MNEVELLGHYGSDEVIAQSAWTSTSREMTEGKRERIGKLLNMLASQGHHTPFEKTGLHFLVTTDIATHIQLLKHRIGVSINAESARYKELKEDKYYIPEDWNDICPQITDRTIMDDPSIDPFISWAKHLKQFTEHGNKLYHQCVKELEPVLGRKRAKESARFFKTYKSQITADIMFNWRSFYHFLNLRNKEDAQLEIRELAGEMLNLVKSLQDNPFKHTIEAFKV